MWIELMESIPAKEAELMELVKDKIWPFKNITKEIAEEGANIVDMLNKSRGDYAYTLIDIEYEIPNTVIENIKQVEGILKVRAL